MLYTLKLLYVINNQLASTDKSNLPLAMFRPTNIDIGVAGYTWQPW